MAVSTLTVIILVTFAARRTHAKETGSDNVLDVVLALKQEWTMKFAQQQHEISSLKRRCVEQENDITELKKKTEEQESEVKALKKKTFELEHEVAELKTEDIEQENAAEELNRSSVKHDKQIAKPHDAFQGQIDARRIRERQTPERVAFSLYLSHPQEHTGIGQKIKFDAVLLNEGNGYNPHIAAFVAPTKGLYLFAYSIGKVQTGQAVVHLMKNGNAINTAMVHVETNGNEQQSGNVALVELDVGDIVCVEEYSTADAKLYSSSAYRYTTFSGVLLM